MHASRLASLALAIAGLTLPSAARANPPVCTSSCTPGAVQCGPDGGIQTCTLAGSSGSQSCPAAAELVYVVDEDNTFSSFTPGTNPTFNDIGTLNCPDQNGGTPFSMSVDRSGTAWVLYSDGTVFTVNTTTLACTATSYNSSSTGWSNFGMGFVAQTAGGSTDNLFIANTSPLQLGILNTSTMDVSTVGSLSGSPELTGTGNAQLYGFFPDANHPRVSELDQTTGAESNPMPMSALAGSPEAWAFAFYGGDFWVFLERTSDNSTNVWHLDGTTGAVTEALSDTGRNIVGAGESTCVPATSCYDWVTTPCPSNNTCSNGACTQSCAGSCTVGATQCGSDGMPQTCGFNNEISSPCPEWIDQPCTSACGGSGVCLQSCTEGAEISTCPSGDTCQSDQGGWYCLPAPSSAASTSAGNGSGTSGTSGNGSGTNAASGTTAGTNGAAGNGSGTNGAAGNAAGANGTGANGTTSSGSGASGANGSGASGANGSGLSNGAGNGAAGTTGAAGAGGTSSSISGSGGCASGLGGFTALDLLLVGVALRRRPRS